MRVLVTGGNRYIGRDLVFELARRGHEVTVINSHESPAHDHDHDYHGNSPRASCNDLHRWRHSHYNCEDGHHDRGIDADINHRFDFAALMFALGRTILCFTRAPVLPPPSKKLDIATNKSHYFFHVNKFRWQTYF